MFGTNNLLGLKGHFFHKQLLFLILKNCTYLVKQLTTYVLFCYSRVIIKDSENQGK